VCKALLVAMGGMNVSWLLRIRVPDRRATFGVALTLGGVRL
jgi:hypothetical protein